MGKVCLYESYCTNSRTDDISIHVFAFKACIECQHIILLLLAGLLDNVFSDYLWVKATQLTTTTVATAGLSIQVPIAAIVDSITGQAPGWLEYLGAVFVMVGFTGINIPSDASSQPQAAEEEEDEKDIDMVELGNVSPS